MTRAPTRSGSRNGRIQRFGANGAYISQVPTPEGAATSGMAVDPVSGDLYFTDPSKDGVLRLDPASGTVLGDVAGATSGVDPGNAATGADCHRLGGELYESSTARKPATPKSRKNCPAPTFPARVAKPKTKSSATTRAGRRSRG